MSEIGIQKYLETLPDNQPGIALDIGANFGLYTDLLAKKFDYVYAFEPLEDNINILRKNVLKPNVTIIPKAIGASNEPAKIYLNPFNPGGHSMNIRAAYVKTWGHSEENFAEVPCITLDEFYNTIPAGINHPLDIKFIKCDVEGAETFIFEAGKEMLRNNKLTMLLEVHRLVDIEKLYALFKELGYNIFYVDADTPRLQRLELKVDGEDLTGKPALKFDYDVHYLISNEK